MKGKQIIYTLNTIAEIMKNVAKKFIIEEFIFEIVVSAKDIKSFS